MNCDEIREQLSAYLDGELDSAALSTVRAHLDRCPDCLAELESIRRTVRLVAGLKRATAPDSILADINDRLARETLLPPSSPPTRPSRFRRVAVLSGLTAAAAVLLVAVHFTLFSPLLREPAPAPLFTASNPDTRAGAAHGVAEGVSDLDRMHYKLGNERASVSADAYLNADEVHIVLASADTGQARLALANAVSNVRLSTRSDANGLALSQLGLTSESQRKEASQAKSGDTKAPAIEAKAPAPSGLALKGDTTNDRLRRQEAATQQLKPDEGAAKLKGTHQAQLPDSGVLIEVTPEELSQILAELQNDRQVAVADLSWEANGQSYTAPQAARTQFDQSNFANFAGKALPAEKSRAAPAPETPAAPTPAEELQREVAATGKKSEGPAAVGTTAAAPQEPSTRKKLEDVGKAPAAEGEGSKLAAKDQKSAEGQEKSDVPRPDQTVARQLDESQKIQGSNQAAQSAPHDLEQQTRPTFQSVASDLGHQTRQSMQQKTIRLLVYFSVPLPTQTISPPPAAPAQK